MSVVRHPSVLAARLLIVAVALCATCGSALAETQAQKKQAAKKLIREALHREIYGKQEDRQKLLQQAAEADPTLEEARWHLGFVKHHNKWVKADQIPELLSDDLRMAAYHKLRAETEDTVEGQIAIADWCNKRGMHAQERAHLTKVLDINQDHADARNRLGFQRVDDQWLNLAQLDESRQQLLAEQESLADWRPKLEKLREALRHRSEFKRKVAADRILEIHETSAIPALEATLSTDSEDAAALVVEVLSNIAGHEAAQSLVRHAVFSPSEIIRDAAAKSLQPRKKDDYVPGLLSLLFTPIKSRMDLVRGDNGNMMYRHSFFREGQNERQTLVLDTEYRRVPLPGGDRRDTVARALNDAQQNARLREAQLLQQNQFTAMMNERVTGVLKTATGVELPAKPEEWWGWWNKENEVFVEGQKRSRNIQRTEQVAIADRVSDPSFASGSAGASASPRVLDCLAAGTMVWTATGPQAVEKIQVGDLVLSQDSESGELAYKPVLRTTVRPKGRLIRVYAGRDSFETSGGHLFWVSGDGWVKARHLESGMEMHSVAGTVPVDLVEDGGEMKTYNLIVADFNTYFVGESKILCHDNTIRQPTDAVVPGLLED